MKRQHKIKLILHASGLKNVSSAFSKSSPFAVVTQLAGLGTNDEAKILGRTEVISNCLSPQWINYIYISDFEMGRDLYIQVDIYDDNSSKRDILKSMGSARFEIGSVLGQKYHRSAKRLRNGGIIYAIIDSNTPTSAGEFKCKITASLKKKLNSYFELHRRDMYETGALWTPVYRSKIIMMKENPEWEEFTIPFSDFGENIDSPIRILVWSHSKKQRHKLLGERESTIQSLIDASTINKGALKLTKRSEKVEEDRVIYVVASVEGVDTSKQNGNNKPLVSRTSNDKLPATIPAISPPDPTFVDYIQGGCELDLCVAIDFTASNGDPRVPGSPHDISSSSLNEYEMAILAIGGAISKYDLDRRHPVWGFGAKYDNVTRHVFQVGDSAEVNGLREILHAYRKTFQKGVVMSSPVVFTDVITVAAKRAQRKLDAALLNKKQSYTILLILTAGNVSDVNKTVDTLKRVVSAPLSVIIVGIGDNDFTAMKFLDDFQNTNGGRDICNFVKFSSKLSKSELTRATLSEVPGQLESYFKSREIYPIKPNNIAVASMEFDDPQSQSDDEDPEIPPHMYDSDGELQIASQSSLCHNCNSLWLY